MRLNRGVRNALIVCVVILFGGSTMALSNPDFKLGRNIQILFNMFRELNMFYVDSVDSDNMLADAAIGMVASLDPYTEFIPESEMANFEQQTTGKYGGMGSLVRKDGDYVIIAQPFKGFPADKAGLVIGDKLLSFDGQDLKGTTTEKVSTLLKGDPGTSFKLRVEKLLTGEVKDITIRRERISISGVPYYGMTGSGFGYIALSDFTVDCSNDVHRALLELKKQGAQKIILDLRNNGGGILQEAVKIMSLFVPKGTEIVSMRGRGKDENVVFRTSSEPVDTAIPVVVLTNSSSASAAEIVAGAFQDLDRGVLIGQRTFGKGLVQSTHPLGYNSYLKLTTAKYYTPSGRCIQAIDYTHRGEDGSTGLVPDSLINSFTTAGGRKVYDGGGLMPDLKLEPQYISRFALALYAKGYIENFANQFFKNHRQGVDVDSFKLSDPDYDSFLQYMADKDVDFESETSLAIEQLRKKAERDRYLDRIADQLKAMESQIKDDKEANLISYKDDVVNLIENEIITRYHYTEGVSRHNIPKDSVVQEAIKLLQNQERYNQILTIQDTERK